MGEFEIDQGKIAGCANRLVECSSELKRQKNHIDSILVQLASGSDHAGIQQALARIAGNLNAQQMQLKQYGDTLQNIVKTYKNTETAVAAEAPVKKIG